MSISKVTLAAAVMAAGFSSMAVAAVDSTTFNVPFAFSVNGRELPAGKYSISEASPAGVLFIRGNDLASIVPTAPGSNAPDAKPAMVFVRDGAKTSLVGVRTEIIGSRTVPLK